LITESGLARASLRRRREQATKLERELAVETEREVDVRSTR
jgi:hypothetical protein